MAGSPVRRARRKWENDHPGEPYPSHLLPGQPGGRGVNWYMQKVPHMVEAAPVEVIPPAAQPKLSEENVALLNQAVTQALKEKLDTLNMPCETWQADYLKRKAMKDRAATEILALQRGVDSERLKGRNSDTLGALLEQLQKDE